MPHFKVRLESPDMKREDGTPHFRVSRIEAVSEDEAIAALLRREYRACGYKLSDDLLAEHEADEAAPGKTSTEARSKLHTHRQVKPYEIIAIEQVR